MSISNKLLQYYDAERRVLPWREDPTPYHVWISEIMLQQTRVEAGIRYYERFLARFPDVHALAAAAEDEVLKLWEGLGYYSRARNLHKAAQRIVADFEGCVPCAKSDLLSLPGIGEYTAGAILSMAYGQKALTVDGNFYRVGSRLLAYEGSVDAAAGKKAMAEFWLSVLPEDRPGDFNQAVMDLGATICLPNGAPRCERCPVSDECRAFAEGNPEAYPVRAEKKNRPIETRTVCLIRDGKGRVLMQRRPKKGLLAGMWEFPSAPVSSHLLPAEVCAEHTAPDITHIFSHVEWRLWLSENPSEQVRESAIAYGIESRYCSPEEIDELALASVFRKLWERVIRPRL